MKQPLSIPQRTARVIPALALLFLFSTLSAQPQKQQKTSSQPHGPRIYFPATTQDAGSIPQEPGQHTFKFPFQNRGDEPLLITSVKSSTGALAPEVRRYTIPPGAWDTLYGHYATRDRPGPFVKTLWLSCNDTTSAGHARDQKGVFECFIKGTVLPADHSRNPLEGHPLMR